MTRKFVVNGRFVTRPPSGVDRVAIELVTALARRPDVADITRMHPQGDRLHRGWIDALPDDMRGKLSLRPVGHRQGHAWEQVELSLALRDATLRDRPLLSLCSTGPILARNQAVMIHDAQVWDAPHSYSRSFRMGYHALLPVLGRSARHVLAVSYFATRPNACLKLTNTLETNSIIVYLNILSIMARWIVKLERTVPVESPETRGVQFANTIHNYSFLPLSFVFSLPFHSSNYRFMMFRSLYS